MRLRESRWGLAFLLFLIALVFFASVICPPLDERGTGVEPRDAATGTDVAGHEAAEPGPGGVQREAAVPQPEDPAPARSRLVEVGVADADGAPVAGARVVMHRDEGEDGVAHRGRTGRGGVAAAVALPPGDYRLIVTCPGFFPSGERRFSVPAEEPQRLEVTLRRGAVVHGQLFALDGEPLTHGLVRLHALESGETRLIKPDARGSFTSDALPSGTWTVAWIEHRHAEPSGAPPCTLTLAPGMKRRVAGHVDVPGREPLPGRTPRILEVDQ